MDSDRRKVLLGASGTAGAMLALHPSSARSQTTIDGDQVSFQPSGAGSTIRTMQRKARETVSIQDFGAAMDGTTNDYNAISAALSSGATRIVVPGSGTAYFTKTLNVPAGIELAGEGGTLKVPQGINALNLHAGSSLSNLVIDGTGVDDVAGGSGVVLIGDDCMVRNVLSRNFGFHGFASAAGGVDRCTLTDCKALNCGHRGINLSEGSWYNRIVNFEARNCKRAGIILGYLSNFNIVQNVYIDGYSASVGGAGLWVHMNSDYNLFDGIVIGPQDASGNTCPSMLLGAGCAGNSFTHINIVGAGTRGILLWNQDVDHPELGTFNTTLAGNRFSDISIIGSDAGVSDGILMNGSAARLIANNYFDRIYVDRFYNGIRDANSSTSGIEFKDVRFGIGVSNRKMRIGSSADNYRQGRRDNCRGLTAVGSLALATPEYDPHPGIPSSNVAIVQPYPFPVMVFISGMTGSTGVRINDVNVNSSLHDQGNGMYILLPQQTITLVYSTGVPAWRWFGL